MSAITAAVKRITRTRVFIQLLSLVGLNSYYWQPRTICVPAFNCHSCPAATFACPIGVLVNFSTLRIFPLIALGILGLAGSIGGRIWCGFVCPFGFLQDLLHKIPSRKLRLPRAFGYLPWAMLVGLVFAVPFFWPELKLSFCTYCPAGTLESAIPWAIMGVSSPWRLAFAVRVGVLVGIMVMAVFIGRGFCRTLCPLGAMLSLFNRFSLLRIRPQNQCTECGMCKSECPVDIDPVADMNSGACVRCLDCTARCLKLGVK
jgi:ferredoxin-type protein NapH